MLTIVYVDISNPEKDLTQPRNTLLQNFALLDFGMWIGQNYLMPISI